MSVFSRETKLVVEQLDVDGITKNQWTVPILDGWGFSQAMNSSEVTMNEMESGGISKRGKKVFNDSLAPAEWNFSTYMRPFLSTALGDWGSEKQHSVEECLWANFIANNRWDLIEQNWYSYNSTTTSYDSTGSVVYNGTTDVEYNFSKSNVAELGKFNLYFILGGCDTADITGATVYKIEDAVVNSTGIDFDIEGIATLNWTGFGRLISEVQVASNYFANTNEEAGLATSNFIRNRISGLQLVAADTDAFPGASNDGVYNIILTGGSISFENNISYLTPDTLCAVNQPLGHVAGTRNISGSFTAYLDPAAGSTAQLFKDLAEDLGGVTNSFDLTFNIGGLGSPSVAINCPQAHLEVPVHSVEDLISIEVAFSGLATDMNSTDEATITYKGVSV